MHPARHFIYFLMTSDDRSAAEDNEWIRGVLSQLELFPRQATDPVLDSLREDVVLPPGYRSKTKDHQPSIQLQKDLGVRDMHRMTSQCKQANEIRRNAAIRETAEKLLLARNPFPKTARYINLRHKTAFRAEAVALFYHYFFEVDACSPTQWADAVRQRQGGLVLRSALQGSPELVLWRLGEHIVTDTNTFLEELLTDCRMRLLELRGQATNMATIKMTQSLVESAARVLTAMSDSEVRMKEVLQQLEQFKQSRREIHIPAASELGSFSGDMKKDDHIHLLNEGSDDYEIDA